MNLNQSESTNRFKRSVAASYRLKDVLELHRHDRLIDIVPNISATRKSDLVILEKWKKHFRDLDIPYAVIKRGILLTLWKERRV